MQTHRAFTIVELMMSVILAVIVIALAWQLYLGERNRFETDQDRLSGLQGALLLDESLAWDLERLALNTASAGGFTAARPVETGNGRELTFNIVESDDPASPTVKAVAVAYRFDPATGRVMRVAGGVERVFKGLLAEDIQFQLVPVPVIWPSGNRPLAGINSKLMYVKYVLTCLPENQRHLAAEDRSPTGRITLVGAAALRPRGERVYHSYWRSMRSELVEAP